VDEQEAEAAAVVDDGLQVKFRPVPLVKAVLGV
jgi:hypothetical protein